jgi:hypothetical protein
MFDATRFARLARAHWAEHRRGYAWFLGAVVMLHFVLVLILLSTEKGYTAFTTDSQGGMFWSGLFVTAPIFAARHFQALARPGPELVALMRPASTFEKWLLALLIIAVAYPIAYHVAFLVCDAPATWIARAQADTARARELAQVALAAQADAAATAAGHCECKPPSYAVYTVFGEMPLPVGALLSILALQGFAVLGSVVFRASPFLKTLLVGFLVLLATIFVCVLFEVDSGPFFDYWHAEKVVRFPLSALQSVLYPLTWIAVPVLLWLAAFLALREREVA